MSTIKNNTIDTNSDKWDIVISSLQDIYNANEVIPFDYQKNQNKGYYLEHKENIVRSKRILNEVLENLNDIISCSNNHPRDISTKNNDEIIEGNGAKTDAVLVNTSSNNISNTNTSNNFNPIPSRYGSRRGITRTKSGKIEKLPPLSNNTGSSTVKNKDDTKISHENADMKNNTNNNNGSKTINGVTNVHNALDFANTNTRTGRRYWISEYNPKEPIVLGSQVGYKPSKKNSPITDWFQCEVVKISADGTKFEVRDPEPDEFGNKGRVYRCTWKEIILIPDISKSKNGSLRNYPKNKKVLARYPETTTFYPAEVLGVINDGYNGVMCRLRFEGEEEVNKETLVERRLVLPYPDRHHL
ncbi:related to SAGA-associated factor 29 [Saccharomycodes ludwigii]|uniref:Related to SAGA-associated factor 29 n=1 Tax=Saccharomycodes ludwigii TaxID=36035 RepID=A0A376BC59_9ASCO|nr:hypothetical protein SCDLUD_003461 [Saccharomycodes ludwigii]KAH3900476.1 hypothetical protein SCDLUD_003461 [Saccharomycodes ludwigii]SSD62207.1 related to SAGA-associated factor 29 [Saccharomycodes ludwigii]